MILNGETNPAGLEVATFITSLYGAWRAGCRGARRDAVDEEAGDH
jgi:hypothetical protein